jgi:hypothetical protein
MIVIPSVDLTGIRPRLRKFDRGRAAELAPADHKRVVQESTLLAIRKQCSNRETHDRMAQRDLCSARWTSDGRHDL